MNTYYKNTGNMLQVIKTQSLVLCYLLVFFSCTKEKETEHSYPRVTTGLVTNINVGGATFNGSFLQTGNSEIIDHGFVFDTFEQSTIQRGEKISLGSSNGSGSFTATANFGMIAGRKYYVSAYAQNKEKIFYAEPVSFISMGSVPPEIIRIVPSEGLRNDTVVIKGKYFSQQPRNNIVKFGFEGAFVITASDTALTVQVPSSKGSEHVDVFVTTVGQTAQKVSGFKYMKPVITDFSPAQGVIGDTITITGQNFRPNMEVKFNQVSARIYQSDRLSARVIVPASGSAQATISVTFDGLSVIAEQKFIYAKAEVTGLSANYGVIGDTILINGKKFGYQKDAVYVFFGVEVATVLEVDNTSIKLIVPASGGRTSLPVTVRVDGQLAEGNQIFSYLAPVIESFEPQNACGGDTVVIRGQYFLTTNQLNVSFGTYNVDKFDKITDTEIHAVVPFSNGVEELSISVRNNGLTTVSENKFRYLKPEITDITPYKGVKNDQITITGMNFGKYNSNLSVHFDINEAAVLEHSPNKLIVSVPKYSGNKLSEIKIKRDGLTGVSGQKFQYIEPVITDFTPSSGKVGNAITISGQYFSNNISDVRVYCGNFQLDIESCSDNQIVVTIPSTDASTIQPIRVSVDGNEGASAASFEIISPWTRKAAPPNYNGLNSMSWTYKDEGFLALGQNPRNCIRYSPANDQWQIIVQNWDGNYNVQPFFFQIGDYCYYGGKNSWDNNLYQVSLESLEKKDITKLPQQEVISNASSFIIDQKAYVCGGRVHSGNNGYNSVPSNAVWQYDPSTNEWTKKASLPGDRRNLGFAFSHNGKGYAGLGINGENNQLNDIYEYDPLSDTWSRKNNFPIRAYSVISFTVNNRIFAGLGSAGGRAIRDIWEYIPASDSWNHVSIIPNEGGTEAFVFVINNKAYIGKRNFYEFDPSKL